MTQADPKDLDKLAGLANLMADEARLIAKKYFRSGFSVITKSDATPVTVADREIELKLRSLVQEHRPQDGIFGEEFGTTESKSGYTWVFDPIDGTKSFTIGRATFGTLIGLCHEDQPVLGIIDQPILSERWFGQLDKPSLFNSQPIKTRTCKSLKDAVVGTGSASQIAKGDAGRCDRIEAAVKYMVYQGDCYFYGLLANGWLDACIEDQLGGIYDFIALVPIINGAGGKISDWDGKPLTMRSGQSLLACGDPELHDQLLNLIKG